MDIPQAGHAPAAAAGSVNVDRINCINIGLMLAAAAFAWTLPFEMFLLSYAVLGPLHYLTQISWLHDRGCFTTGRFDWVPLAVLGAVASLSVYTTWIPWYGSGLTAFGAGAMAAFVRHPVVKVASLVGIAAVAAPIQSWSWAAFFFTQLLSSFVHVYVFTGIFILAGSMKSRSRSGFVSLAVYLACGAGLLLVRPSAAWYHVSGYTGTTINEFATLFAAMGLLLPGEFTWDAFVAIGRFLAFAYTYHYLNWFSKTGIIRWHEISRRRMAAIGLVYAASLALYAYDYRVGLMVLFFLSIMHVFLEFPLDVRTMRDVVTGMRRLRTASAPLQKA